MSMVFYMLNFMNDLKWDIKDTIKRKIFIIVEKKIYIIYRRREERKNLEIQKER